MKRSIIVAVSQNGVIGADNHLPWRLPSDLKRFKQLTMGHHLIMGRKTFESIGRPLPGRTTIVLTHAHKVETAQPGVLVAGGFRVALELAERGGETEVFICGGGDVYRQALRDDLVDEVYMTVIHQTFFGDTYFTLSAASPDPSGWFLSSEERHDQELELPYSFQLWKRGLRNT